MATRGLQMFTKNVLWYYYYFTCTLGGSTRSVVPNLGSMDPLSGPQKISGGLQGSKFCITVNGRGPQNI